MCSSNSDAPVYLLCLLCFHVRVARMILWSWRKGALSDFDHGQHGCWWQAGCWATGFSASALPSLRCTGSGPKKRKYQVERKMSCQGSEVRLGRLIEDHRKATASQITSGSDPGLPRTRRPSGSSILSWAAQRLQASLPHRAVFTRTPSVTPDDSWNNRPSDLAPLQPPPVFPWGLKLKQRRWRQKQQRPVSNLTNGRCSNRGQSACGRPRVWLPPATPAQQKRASSFFGGQTAGEPTDEKQRAAGRQTVGALPGGMNHRGQPLA